MRKLLGLFDANKSTKQGSEEPRSEERSSTLQALHETLGIKYDQDKPDWSLLPWDVLEQATKVMTYGAKKYSPDNWLKVPDAKKRYFAAFLRHWKDATSGEVLDPESGLPHYAHMVCCALMLAGHLEKDR